MECRPLYVLGKCSTLSYTPALIGALKRILKIVLSRNSIAVYVCCAR